MLKKYLVGFWKHDVQWNLFDPDTRETEQNSGLARCPV